MDRDGRPAAADFLPPARPHGSTAAEKPRACVGCGGYHGSVGVGRLCLEATVRALRARVLELEQGKGT